MSSRYQSVFTISGPGRNGPDLLEHVRNYIRGIVHEQFGIPLAAWTDEGVWENENGELRIDSDRRDSFAYFTLTWKRLDEWEMRWRLSTKGDDVEVEVQVLGPENDRRTAGAPALLDDVLRTYHCRIQSETPYPDVVTVTSENADWYAESLILGQERRIPVAAVSERLRGEPDDRINRAINILRGVATVVTYSYVDSLPISSKLGRLACSGGEVRVYRPGATRNDAQELHRKWRPNDVDWGEVRDECMHLLALSEEPRLYHEVREEIFRRWDAELAEEDDHDAESAARIQSLEAELAEARETAANVQLELENTKRERTEEIERYETRITSATDEASRLTTENSSLQEQLDQLSGLADKDAQRDSLITNLQQQRDRLQQSLDARKNRNEELESRIEEGAKESNEYKRQLEDSRNSFQYLERDYKAVIADRDALQGQVNEAAHPSTDKHSGRKEIGRLRGELRDRESLIEDLRKDLSAMENRNRELQRELAEQGQHIEDIRQGREPYFEPGDEPPDLGESLDFVNEPKSVTEVVLNTQHLDGLRLLESAFRSANRSPYVHLESLQKALRAISECGIAKAKGSLDGDLRGWFKSHGVDYRPHESESTNRREPRIWTDDQCGKDLGMEEHIALGGGGNRDPKDVLRIHMAWCDKEKLWIIGHVGRHLGVATS